MVVIFCLVSFVPPSLRAIANEGSLVDAARVEDWDAVRGLIGDGINPRAVDVDRNQAIHWAVRADAIEVAELLLGAGADASAENLHGVTPLYLATRNAHVPMMEILLEAGADGNQVDVTGETVLMLAAQTGEVEAVRTLLAHGAEVNAAEPRYGMTPMMYASRDGHVDVIEALLEHGADITIRTETAETPAHRLPCIGQSGCGSHGLGIVRGGLPERGRRDPIPGAMTALMYASREGHLDSVGLLLDAGAEVNEVDMNDVTPLMLAISNNRLDVARHLIEEGANIHQVDWYGRTPLWLAVEMRNVDIHYTTFEHMVDPEEREALLGFARDLLEMGADPNIRIQEVPPLRSWLYLLGGSLAWVDFTGQTPFLLASLSGDVETMRLLLEYGADPHIPTFEGTTPLMAAAGVNWVSNQTYTEWDTLLEAIQLCWELGMDVNAVNSMGLTAVMGAANRGSDDIIRFLVEKGGRLDAKDNEGRTSLDWAGGVFLATHAPEPKPSSIALIRELMGDPDVVAVGDGN
jgi:ankyrin repeat protein